MERAVIAVSGEADRLVADGLEELRPVLAGLRRGVLIIGGLMTRIWLHARPIGVPARATADVDLGIDRRALGLVGDRKVVEPLLRAAGFEPRLGNEEFRFEKDLDGRTFPVDLGIAPGGSREEPPVLEHGMTTIAVPGLAYAMQRRTSITTEFLDRGHSRSFDLPVPTLDAAFVLKGALVASGVRRRADRRQRDTVDAISLAAACANDSPSMEALGTSEKRSDVRDAVGWIREAFSSPRSAAAARVEAHFDEEGIADAAEWAVAVAGRFSERLERKGT